MRVASLDTLLLLERMYKLAIHDASGRQWFPLLGYADEVVAYAPAEEAFQIFWSVRGVEVVR